MSIRPLVFLPDALLRSTSEPVKAIDKDVSILIGDMLETMYDAPGIGLAAVQVGRPIRLITIDLSKKPEDGKNPQVFINPEIIWQSDDLAPYEEGCLSIPDYFAEVTRPSRVKVRYRDAKGAAQEVLAEGLLATCLQHEIDHLNGILFIDHISKLKRTMVIKKFTKLARERGEG